MSAIIETTSQASPVTGNFNNQTVKLRQITTQEYDLMIESGVFDKNDPIELLNGVIIEKMPKGTKHSAANDRATKMFYKTLSDKAVIRNQNPIWLDDFSEPDIVLAKLKDDEYNVTIP